MKHYIEFERSGETFADRMGEASEVDAAIGRMVFAFSLLEDMIRGLIQVLLATGDPNVANIVTAEMSFRQLVDGLGALGRYRIDSLPVADRADALEYLDEALRSCRKAEELRNTYLHSSYVQSEVRIKTTAKATRGLHVRSEQIDSALLLDVADFISETAWTCQELPFGIRFADSGEADGERMEYFRDTQSVGRFVLPGCEDRPLRDEWRKNT